MNWEQIAAELQAYREAQRRLWGNVDDMTLARYLAGTCDEAERAAVEEAVHAYPAVRELVAGLRELSSPADATDPAEAAADAARGGESPPASRRAGAWLISEGTRRLAESLVVRAARNGRVQLGGLEEYSVAPLYTAMSESTRRDDAALWSDIPLDPLAAALSIACRYLPAAAEWEVQLSCRAPADGSDLEARGVVTVEDERTGGCEFRLGLRECVKQPILLGDGDWRVTLTLGDQSWQAPLVLRSGAPGP